MIRAIKVFEPVTQEQIMKLQSSARQVGLSSTDKYQLVSDLIGVSSITALSKQEAIFLIDRLQGKTKHRYPAGPRFEDEISGDTSRLPSFYHIRDIRLMAQELGWDKQRFKNWLIKYRKVKDIRSMDRKQARATYSILQGMVEHKKGAEQDNNKGNTKP